MANLFLRHLKQLAPEHLEIVLRNRPDAMARPWPRTIQDLSDRLMKPESINRAIDHLSLPQVEVLAAINMLGRMGSRPTVETVRARLAAAPDDLSAVLGELESVALTWTNPDGTIETLARIATGSTPDGWPIDYLLVDEPVQTLRNLCIAHGVDSTGVKGQLIPRLTARFRDDDHLRNLINARPETEILRAIDRGEPVEFSDLYAHRARPELEWFATHGLVWPREDGLTTLPFEVQIALRRPDWHLPFHPVPPTASVTKVSSEHVDQEARAATLRLIERVTTLVDDVAAEPIALTKTSTLPVRTLRSYAKRWDCTENDAAFAFTTLLFLDVAAPHNEPPPLRPKRGSAPPPPTLRPTDRAVEWPSLSIAERARLLVEAWWRATTPVTLHNKPEQNTTRSDQALRHAIVSLHADLPPGTARDDSAIQLVWRIPVLTHSDELVLRLLRETELVGALALGAAASLGRGLVAGDVDDAVKAVEANAATTATFGTDLTAVVFGPPDLATARLLDSVALRESQGAATTWRFSPESLRRTFDEGASPDAVLADLNRIAANGIPQTLEYLINDVHRSHGRLVVASVACVIVSDDQALLKEVSVNRKLAKLGLRLLAPTVVTSNATSEATLEALRGAGYSPATEDGKVHVTRSRAVSSTRPESPTATIPEPDLAWHAKHLLESSGSTNPSHMLFHALMHRTPYEVLTHLNYGGAVALEHNSRKHVVHSARVSGNIFSAWSITTERYEEFPVNEVRLTRHS